MTKWRMRPGRLRSAQPCHALVGGGYSAKRVWHSDRPKLFGSLPGDQISHVELTISVMVGKFSLHALRVTARQGKVQEDKMSERPWPSGQTRARSVTDRQCAVYTYTWAVNLVSHASTIMVSRVSSMRLKAPFSMSISGMISIKYLAIRRVGGWTRRTGPKQPGQQTAPSWRRRFKTI